MLDEAQVKATFFFSVGPDNMGATCGVSPGPRSSGRCSGHGRQACMAGTFYWRVRLAGKPIGRDLGQLMRRALDAGHEVGLHAWDHHGWQANAGRWNATQLTEQIRLGVDCLSDILGHPVLCSAAAGWRADQHIVQAKQAFGFRYNSDCRGTSLFRPLLIDGSPGAPQIR
ncbi:polysaccharide deacetylase family protein [Pseudomonas syringae pv. actinidiae]|nr:polysaccharide deacetylase family protein [Pseudomonas syringae pv. actinidiae]